MSKVSKENATAEAKRAQLDYERNVEAAREARRRSKRPIQGTLGRAASAARSFPSSQDDLAGLLDSRQFESCPHSSDRLLAWTK